MKVYIGISSIDIDWLTKLYRKKLEIFIMNPFVRGWYSYLVACTMDG